MKKIRLLCLACLLALVPMGSAWAFDGGGDDGGFDDGGFDDGGDDGGFDDGGEDQDEGENHDEGHHHDGDGPHGGGHHHNHWAGHHHHGGWGLIPFLGLGFGPGFGYGGYGFMQPIYSYPPVMAQPAPPVYIQQQNAGASAPDSQTSFWHYCRAPEGYYPEVKDCPDGWQQVAPQPASPPPPEATSPLPQDNQG